jgi:murein DD-endopeptidase MepM/ murein hydrolase activator NlpD
VIDHGYGVRTTFGHAQRVFVREGETVERGQQIAAVGSTGRSTGPHLHYAIERNGRLTNPIDYIVE